MKTVTLQQAKIHLSKLIGEAAKGQPFIITFAVLLLVLESLIGSALAQQKAVTTPAIDWESLKPQIEAVLNAAAPCNEQRRWIAIGQVADVTGEGVPEALVEYCHMGAYTSDVMLMRLQDDKPVAARFRDDHGKVIQPEFMEGSSVMHGAGTGLLPDQHAVYSLSWDTSNSGGFDKDKCRTQAYVWNASSQTFDFDTKLSKLVTEEECRRVRQEIGCGEHPCPREAN